MTDIELANVHSGMKDLKSPSSNVMSNMDIGAGLMSPANPNSKSMPLGGGAGRKKKSHVLEKNEEFMEYRDKDLPDGTKKRVKVVKRTEKKVKVLTEE